jgi:hypothetical protein
MLVKQSFNGFHSDTLLNIHVNYELIHYGNHSFPVWRIYNVNIGRSTVNYFLNLAIDLAIVAVDNVKTYNVGNKVFTVLKRKILSVGLKGNIF